MKKSLIIIAGLLLTACGENFQGNFKGTAVSNGGNCGVERTVGAQFDITVSTVISGNNAALSIVQLTPLAAANVSASIDAIGVTTFAERFKSLEMKLGLENNRRFVTTNSQYERRVPDNGGHDGVDLSKYDEIIASGEITADRTKINSLNVTYKTDASNGSAVVPCEFRLTTSSPLLLER